MQENVVVVPVPTERLTKNEKLVFQALQLADKPQKAYDLLDVLKNNGIRAPMTIYRALEGLVQKGVVHKLADLNAYVLCNHDHPHPIEAFLVCDDCGNVQEVESGMSHSLSVEEKISAAVSSSGFDMRGARIEIKGKCTTCVDQVS